ncbi:MAG TPA: hypothetical protein DEB24_08670 [Coriobacteriia bacterium]|nr:hypothetical protein [Coriobacteriia bacterium]
MVHRLLKYLLASDPLPDNMEAQLDGICAHASERERESDRASAEATALKFCEYLEPRCGESFWAVITSVNSYGMAIREDSTTADGFIRVEDMERGFFYDPASYRYHNPETGKSFRLGQPLRVTLTGVDRQSLRLQFVVA